VSADADKPLILFDGDCNLCNGTVQFVIKRDPAARFRFASLQSDAAKAALVAAGVTEALPDSIVLVADGRVRTKSAAALAIARKLGGLWALLSIFWILPYPLRDVVYDWIARNRYRWFGKQETCWVPTPELRARFADIESRTERSVDASSGG